MKKPFIPIKHFLYKTLASKQTAVVRNKNFQNVVWFFWGSILQQVLPFISDSNSVNKNPISELSVKDSKKFLRLNKRRFKVFISKLNKEKNYISIPIDLS